ncbi:hypothetical protein GCM10027346_11980 [Hymenobacter seoulensis]
MELDTFRRSWQQPVSTDATAAFDAVTLSQLLKRNTSGSLPNLVRNARLEIGFTVALLLVTCVGLFYAKQAANQASFIWILILCLVSLVSYHRYLFNGIKGLGNASATVRENVAQQVERIREVMNRSYRSALWSLPISFGIGFYFSLTNALATYSGKLLLMQLAVLVIGYGLVWWFTHWLMARFARQYLQELYGQHLDRLEATLRELGE